MALKSSDIVNSRGRKIQTILAGVLSFVILLCISGCNDEPKQATRKSFDYIKAIPGPSDPVLPEIASKGQVLIGYSDCYSCHKEDRRSVGPAFKDIAKRYPVNEAYIDYLAKKIISGGSGSWGAAVMTPHPQLSAENAKTMVSYILSLRE
ncbi:c-type cytochrome [Niabella sp.]|uniref:c-type cytochrome n=1 Tax=Niabella sp. TaxID=1962976 RepID=UPI002632B900|nr:c-type cytochrome [Niabella sp.]